MGRFSCARARPLGSRICRLATIYHRFHKGESARRATRGDCFDLRCRFARARKKGTRPGRLNCRPAPQADAATIRRALDLMVPTGIVELRMLNGRGTASGYFDADHRSEAVTAAARYAGRYGVYFIPNPVLPALLSRASNRVIDFPKQTTADADIERRLYLLDRPRCEASGRYLLLRRGTRRGARTHARARCLPARTSLA